ncbi:oxidoreductase HTATIP2-like [Mytilus edulis]|uniref:oxidoreductase HTATIP2-like n=1 Tax=Mytilus edulis TaxID=6550 RepID=UPI0039F12983
MSIEVDSKNTLKSDRMAFVLGYTGETGKALVKELSRRKVFKKVMLIGRREVQFEKDLGPEFEQKVVDFDHLNDYKHEFQDLDTGFSCIGTSKAKSGGKAGFIKVDHDYVVNAAAMAKSVGCKHFLVVSSYGANKDSSFLYIKTKGEVEEDLKSINFDNLSIFRPGMLLCDRVERRPIEACIRCCWKPMPQWFVKEGAINTDNLAAAMVNKALNPSFEKVENIENKQIYELI